MNMFTTDDRPDFIDDLEQVANLFETGKYDYFKGMENEVWEVARQSEDIPHFSNIYSSIVFSRLENSLSDEFKELDLQINTYINSIDTHFEINGKNAHGLEEIGDRIIETYNEKKEHIDSSALDDIKEKMLKYFDYEVEEEQVQSKSHDELAVNTRRNK